MARDIDAEIERLSARRHALWAGADEEVPQEAIRIGAKLAELYAEKRGVGAPTREAVQRTARVELELERLSSPDAPRRKKS